MLWGFGSAWMYHVLAGIRHMLMDLGYGESLPAGRYSAIAVMVLAGIAIIFLGVWIW
jgi:succinate dehydrogenase / fumarate reductase cytochrome b subunit